MSRRLFWLLWAGIVAFSCCICAYTAFWLQFRFGGYDLSPLIDSGWRLMQGQVPNRDFLCTFPPITYLGAGLAFRLFGVHWTSLTAMSVLFTLVLTVCGMRVLLLLRARLGEAPVLRLSFVFAVLQAIPLLVVGHPWHSTWTQAAALWAFVATFALLELPAPVQVRARWELLVHLGLAETLLILAKPNTGMPTLVFCTGVLLLRKELRVRAVGAVCAAGVLASLAMLAVHTTLLQQWRTYSSLNSRFVPKGYLDQIVFHRQQYLGLEKLTAFIAVLPALVWVLWLVGRSVLQHRLRAVHLLGLGACLVSIIGFGTNADYPIVDTPAMLLGAALLASTAWSSFAWFESAYAFGLYSLLVLAGFFCGTRQRMQQVGEWGDSCGNWFTSEQDPFFGHFHSCPAFFDVLHAADRAVADAGSRDVFFGPRLEFLYARERLASPHGLPLWWHPGTSYPVSRESAVAEAWKQDHFGLLILLHNDRTRLPEAILDAINHDYVLRRVLPPLESDAVAGQVDDGRIDIYVPR